MADRRGVDIISSRRDPDRRRPAGSRLLAVAVAAALAAGAVGAQLILGRSSHVPRHQARGSLSSVTVAAPSMLHGTPLRPGAAAGTVLFLGGNQLRRLNVADQASALVADALPGTGPAHGTGPARDPLGPGAVVRQIISVAGGIVVVIAGDGPAGLPDIGDVLFIPVSGSRVGVARLMARANYAAVAPNHRDIWVEQAGPPYGNGPADSPAWLVGESGRRLSAAVRLHGRVLDTATVRGLLVRGPPGQVGLVSPATGAAVPSGVPGNAVIVSANSDQVAWQAASCMTGCLLHVTSLLPVTSLRSRPDAEIALPPGTSLDLADTPEFDPAGQRLALPLDTVNNRGLTLGTYVYVADINARTLTRLPGGPIPLAALPAVPGAIPAGTSDVVSVRWAADGPGLWIVATDGLFFQAAYWTGTGPLQVLRPHAGLAYKFSLPGPGAPGQ